MSKPGIKKFVLRSLLALLPVALYVALYAVVDPFKVVHAYNGVSIAPGDSLERIPNKRYVAIEGLKFYDPQYHYDSFIFGSSISSNFTAEAWKRHLPDDASVYHFTAGANTLTGIRDELRYLRDNGVPVRNALLIMEDEMFHRQSRMNEMPYVPHPDVSPEVSRLHFHFVHFNAFRDPCMLLYNLVDWPWVGDKLLEDGKMVKIPSGRDEVLNEDSSRGLDSIVLSNPKEYYSRMPWLMNMKPQPNVMPLSIDANNEPVLRDIARLLKDCGTEYVIIVPPRYLGQPMSAIDHGALCKIMGESHVKDFSADSTLIHDITSYYDGVHILTHRCSELIDRSYEPSPFTEVDKRRKLLLKPSPRRNH